MTTVEPAEVRLTDLLGRASCLRMRTCALWLTQQCETRPCTHSLPSRWSGRLQRRQRLLACAKRLISLHSTSAAIGPSGASRTYWPQGTR